MLAFELKTERSCERERMISRGRAEKETGATRGMDADLDNVRVPELAKELDLPDGVQAESILHGSDLDLLDGDLTTGRNLAAYDNQGEREVSSSSTGRSFPSLLPLSHSRQGRTY